MEHRPKDEKWMRKTTTNIVVVFGRVFRCHSKLDHSITVQLLGHSNTGLVWYSDHRCLQFKPNPQCKTFLPNKTCEQSMHRAGPESRKESAVNAKGGSQKKAMPDECRDVQFTRSHFSHFWHSNFGVWTSTPLHHLCSFSESFYFEAFYIEGFQYFSTPYSSCIALVKRERLCIGRIWVKRETPIIRSAGVVQQ